MKHEYQKPTAQWLSFRVDCPISVSGNTGWELDEVNSATPVNGKQFNEDGTITGG